MPVILLVTHRPPAGATVDRADRIAGAGKLAALPGLRWKVWLAETDGEAGGVYLFDDAATADAWAERVGGLLAASGDLSIRRFAIDETLSAITHAPLGGPAAP